jgi:hypothetical protein
LPLLFASVAIALGTIVGVLDTVTRTQTGSWWLEADLLRESPNARQTPTLLLAALVLALVLDLRAGLGTDLRAPTRPPKEHIAPWRRARGLFVAYYRIVVGRLALGAVLMLTRLFGGNVEIVTTLGLGLDVLFALASAWALALVARRAPAARALAAAAACAHVIAVIVLLTVRSELVAVSALGSVFICAVIGAVGRDVRDLRLPRLAKEALATCVLGGIGAGALVYIARRAAEGRFSEREAWVELIPLVIAFPLAATIALTIAARRVVYVLRTPA